MHHHRTNPIHHIHEKKLRQREWRTHRTKIEVDKSKSKLNEYTLLSSSNGSGPYSDEVET